MRQEIAGVLPPAFLEGDRAHLVDVLLVRNRDITVGGTLPDLRAAEDFLQLEVPFSEVQLRVH